MSDADVSEVKAALRRRMKALLMDLAPGSAERAGQRISQQLARAGEWRDADAVAVYATLPGEVDTTMIVERAREQGKATLFPRISARGGLDFVSVAGGEDLVAGRFGVLEPRAELPRVRLDASVLVLVPGLAFDRCGGRLGRGGGYYDRTLAAVGDERLRGRRLGVAFSLQVVDCVATQPHDVSLDGLVTEDEFVRVA